MAKFFEISGVVYDVKEEELYSPGIFYLCRRKDLDDFTKYPMVLIDAPITQSVEELKSDIKKVLTISL